MTEEDLKTTIREFKASVSAELVATNLRIDSLEASVRGLADSVGVLVESVALQSAKLDLVFDTLERGLITIGARFDLVDQRLRRIEEGPRPHTNGNGRR